MHREVQHQKAHEISSDFYYMVDDLLDTFKTNYFYIRIFANFFFENDHDWKMLKNSPNKSPVTRKTNKMFEKRSKPTLSNPHTVSIKYKVLKFFRLHKAL